MSIPKVINKPKLILINPSLTFFVQGKLATSTAYHRSIRIRVLIENRNKYTMASWSSWLTDQVADATGVDVSGVVAGVSGVGEQLTGALASVSGDLQEFVDTVQVSQAVSEKEKREERNGMLEEY